MMSEYQNDFLSPNQAREKYHLYNVNEIMPAASEVERQLAEHGIVAIEMPLSPSDFQRLSEGFDVVIDEHPELLASTLYNVDSRYGGDAGYTRKEKKIDQRTGLQSADPKHYFHFTETARPRWRDQLAQGPKVMRDFLEDGYEVHDALIGVAKETIGQLETTHPNISRLYFPNNDSFSFMRLLRYDGYTPNDTMGEVAKPHYDIGGVTVQAYADAPGFWAAKDGVHGERVHYDTADNQAYTFLGKGHEKVYGPSDTMKPLWHGVDRIIPAGVTWVPERTAVILFVDAPEVDYHVREYDTKPQLYRGLGSRALVSV